MRRVLRDYPEISVNPQTITGPIDFKQIFGRQGHVHVEIGSGNGTFLLNQAQSLPEIDFLGIEWANKYYKYAVDRIGRWGLKNVRIIRTDAAVFISDYIPDSSVDCFHIYFPDPWPKKRHHKRRFICPANIEQMIRCLVNAGIIQIATDHLDYFEQMKICFAEKHEVLEQIDFIPSAGACESEFAGTNYERKYIKENRKVYTIAVRKACFTA